MFRSLETSGQSDYYQDSDWAKVLILGDYITAWYDDPRLKMGAIHMANIMQMMSSLGVSEGDRRQVMRVELDLPETPEESEAVVAIANYKDRLKKKAN